MDDFYKNLGQLIKEKRLEKNLTTQELADILGVSIGFISNLENAKTDTFNAELMMKLHKTLNISLFNFLPIYDSELCANDLSSPITLREAPANMTEILSTSINTIISTYINTIKNHNFDTLFIDKISTKLLHELNYIDDFKL